MMSSKSIVVDMKLGCRQDLFLIDDVLSKYLTNLSNFEQNYVNLSHIYELLQSNQRPSDALCNSDEKSAYLYIKEMMI